MHESGVLGASPAGIIRRADLLEVMQLRPDILEVMCPFTARNMTIPEAIYKECMYAYYMYFNFNINCFFIDNHYLQYILIIIRYIN